MVTTRACHFFIDFPHDNTVSQRKNFRMIERRSCKSLLKFGATDCESVKVTVFCLQEWWMSLNWNLTVWPFVETIWESLQGTLTQNYLIWSMRKLLLVHHMGEINISLLTGKLMISKSKIWKVTEIIHVL